MITIYMERLRAIFGAHKWAIAFALFVGFLMVLPQLIFIAHTPNYKGLYMMETDAEVHYLARMNESIGTGSIGNPYNFEDRDTVSPFNTLSESVLALPARVLPLTVSELNMWYKFLLPAVIFLLIYTLFFQLVHDKKWSLVVGLAVLLGSAMVNLPDIIHLLKLERVYSQFALYSRPVNPELSSIVFFAFLNMFLLALKKRNWSLFITLGALFGLSFYFYLYTFTFIATTLVVFALIFLVKKEYDLCKKILVAFMLGLALGSYELYNIFLVINHPLYKSLSAISDIKNSHLPIFSLAGFIVTALFAIFLWYQRNQHQDFLAGLLITSWLVINQQILTGIVLQSGHYHWYYNTPIYLIILFWLAYQLSSRFDCKKVTLFLLLISAVFIFDTVFIQYSSYTKWNREVASNQEVMLSLAWLKENTPKESVVLANMQNANLVPIFIHDYVAWSNYGDYYLVPQERRENTPTVIMKDPLEFKKKYRLDYIFWDKKADPTWSPNLSYLNLIYSDQRVNIYAFSGHYFALYTPAR